MASIERDETYETITVSLSFENFLSFLMGKRSTHGLAGQLSKHQWKQLLRRVNRYIVKAINLNVQTDSFHRSRIALALDRLDIATTEEQNSEYIFALLWLLFEVLGGRPDNWHRRTVNRPEYLRLNRCRSLAYIQSSYQKVATILEAAQYPPYSTIHKHEDLLVLACPPKIGPLEMRDSCRITTGGNSRENKKVFGGAGISDSPGG